VTVADARPFHWEFRPDPVAREVFRVAGGHPLEGTVAISGAKNAALKLLAAATLTGERCRFTNVPEIEDVRVMGETLRDLLLEHKVIDAKTLQSHAKKGPREADRRG